MMTLAQLHPSEETLWWIALGIGAVVVAVVIALLSLLVRLVSHIDKGVAETWETATQVAANTATTWQLQKLLNTGQKLRAEALRHAALLEEVGSS